MEGSRGRVRGVRKATGNGAGQEGRRERARRRVRRKCEACREEGTRARGEGERGGEDNGNFSKSSNLTVLSPITFPSRTLTK